MNRYSVFLPFGCLSLMCGVAHAEIEHLAGPRNILIATDHTSPEQIGPVVHHHHHDGSPERFEFELSVGLDSRYVSEGRDNLPGEGGIGWATATGHVHALGGAFFGEVVGIAGWEADYEELNLVAGYEVELGAVTLGGAVSWLWFPEDDEEDLELALFAEWLHECGAGIAVEGVWSTDAEGWFGEASLFYEWEVCQSFTLIPSIFIGANQGYVSDGHDGFNHLGFQIEGAVPLSEHIELSTYAAFIEPLDEDRGEGLRDLFWVGGALTFSF